MTMTRNTKIFVNLYTPYSGLPKTFLEKMFFHLSPPLKVKSISGLKISSKPCLLAGPSDSSSMSLYEQIRTRDYMSPPKSELISRKAPTISSPTRLFRIMRLTKDVEDTNKMQKVGESKF